MRREKIGFVVGLRTEARLLRGLGYKVAIGGGAPDGAIRAAELLIARDAEALVSFGFAGGLIFGMSAGSIVIPQSVLAGEEQFVCDSDLLAWLGGPNARAMLAGTGIAVTTGQKAALFSQSGACAVDLESGAVARVATMATVPFAVLRAISDPADRDLPPAALVALNSGGRVSGRRVFGSVIKRPAQILELVRLARNAAAARKTLRWKLEQLA